MPSKKEHKKNPKQKRGDHRSTSLKSGDMVMIIAGGNKEKRPIKGQVGKLKAFTGKYNDRAIVEGLNMITKHQRQTTPDRPAGKIQKEASIHVSNLMYYVEKLKKPVRLKHNLLEDGSKVRGYINPETKQFVQI
ncbi:MAG: 50S ribosomal protein L24 [Bdellovibrionales bacterium]|nr:50S ribosomal protein L24 [Bdellovibrionales bacterium]